MSNFESMNATDSELRPSDFESVITSYSSVLLSVGNRTFLPESMLPTRRDLIKESFVVHAAWRRSRGQLTDSELAAYRVNYARLADFVADDDSRIAADAELAVCVAGFRSSGDDPNRQMQFAQKMADLAKKVFVENRLYRETEINRLYEEFDHDYQKMIDGYAQ